MSGIVILYVHSLFITLKLIDYFYWYSSFLFCLYWETHKPIQKRWSTMFQNILHPHHLRVLRNESIILYHTRMYSRMLQNTLEYSRNSPLKRGMDWITLFHNGLRSNECSRLLQSFPQHSRYFQNFLDCWELKNVDYSRNIKISKWWIFRCF